MIKCAKCGVEVQVEDLYEERELMVCEDCKLKGTNSPAIPCGGDH